MTKREALALEERFGGRYVGDALDWIETTAFGDTEQMFLLQTPNCAYCGQSSPLPRCVSCGASVLRDGELEGRRESRRSERSRAYSTGAAAGRAAGDAFQQNMDTVTRNLLFIAMGIL